jgi:hypothetical protein
MAQFETFTASAAKEAAEKAFRGEKCDLSA